MYATVDQIATEYNRHPMYIRKLARAGVLAAVKVNGEWHIDTDIARQYFSNRRNIVAQAFEVVEVEPARYTMSSRTFGVEIEVTGISHYAVTTALENAGINVYDSYNSYNHTDSDLKWKVMSDSSISGEGCEIVSPILRNEAGLAEITRVSNALIAAGAKINKSCGLHVHVGADDLSVTAVRNIVESYENNATLIASFLSPSRRNNTYCQNYGSYDRSHFANCATIEAMSQVAGSRYYAVNLQSYGRHGTVEFRQHQGTVEHEKINNWVRFAVALADFAKSDNLNPVNSVSDLMNSLNLPETVVNYFTSRTSHFANA